MVGFREIAQGDRPGSGNHSTVVLRILQA
jgi:hypothetical protein